MTEVLSEEVKAAQAAKTKRAAPEWIAVVRLYPEPTDSVTTPEGRVVSLRAATKRELSSQLEGPSIQNIIGLMRGKILPFAESRKVSF